MNIDIHTDLISIPYNQIHNIRTAITLSTTNSEIDDNIAAVIVLGLSDTYDKRLSDIKSVINNFLLSANENVLVNVVWGGKSSERLYKKMETPTSAVNVDHLPQTSGCMVDSIVKAIKLLSTVHTHHCKMIVITDCIFTYGSVWNLLLSHIKLAMKRKQFPIYSFSIGSLPDPLHLIKMSAKSAGGVYKHISLDDDIIQTISRFFQSLHYKTFQLTLVAPKGTRISKIAGQATMVRCLIDGKKYIYHVGNIGSNNQKFIYVILSVRPMRKDEPFYQKILNVETPITIPTNEIYVTKDLFIKRTLAQTIDRSPMAKMAEVLSVESYMRVTNAIFKILYLVDIGKVKLGLHILDNEVKLLNEVDSQESHLFTVDLDKLRSFIDSDHYEAFRCMLYNIVNKYAFQLL
jgi:hypothetical protein